MFEFDVSNETTFRLYCFIFTIICFAIVFVAKAKACGVVVRASDSQLGDPGSNLGSAKSLSMIG